MLKFELHLLDLNKSEEEHQILRADIEVNGVKIDSPSPWSTVDFIDNIRAGLNGNTHINDAVIKVSECPSTGPLNEAIDTVVEMSNV